MQDGFQLGEWTVYPLLGQIRRDDEQRRIQPKSMDVLVHLAKTGTEVALRDDIIAQVWGPTFVSDEPLTRCIGELRKALGDTRGGPSYIETIPKRGYRIVAEILPLAPNEAEKSPEKQFAVSTTENSIAVIPFKDMSPNQDHSYLAEGLAEEIMDKLISTTSLKVAAPASVAQVRDQSLATIRQQLQVRYVLEGSVRTHAERMRIAIRISDTTDGFQLVSRTYDRTFGDIFSVQDEIARCVVELLPGTIQEHDQSIVPAQTPLLAHEKFLKGLYGFRRRTPESLKQALDYFEQATTIDSQYAKAYAAKAYIYSILPWYTMEPEPKTMLAKTVEQANNALDIEPNNAMALSALGMAHTFNYKYDLAEQSAERAVTLSPNEGEVRNAYLGCLLFTGKFDKVLEEGNVSLQHDPLSPVLSRTISIANYFKGDMESTERRLKSCLKLDPNFYSAYPILAKVYLYNRELDKAVKCLKMDFLLQRMNHDQIEALANSIIQYQISKQKQPQLFRFEDYISYPGLVAAYYAYLGFEEECFYWLEKSIAMKDYWALFFMYDPSFIHLRENDKFTQAKIATNLHASPK